jgi:hypothetical protein
METTVTALTVQLDDINSRLRQLIMAGLMDDRVAYTKKSTF